jgi:hypothetical protein
MLFFALLKLSFLPAQAMKREEPKNPIINAKKESDPFQIMYKKLNEKLKECKRKFREKMKKKYSYLYLTEDEEKKLQDLNNETAVYKYWDQLTSDYLKIKKTPVAERKNKESDLFLAKKFQIISKKIMSTAHSEGIKIEESSQRALKFENEYIEKYLQKVNSQYMELDSFKSKFEEDFDIFAKKSKLNIEILGSVDI